MSEKDKKLFNELINILTELGWGSLILADPDTTHCYGMIVGESEFLTTMEPLFSGLEAEVEELVTKTEKKDPTYH